jgi:DNA-binding CsgD family transcriptional regulator
MKEEANQKKIQKINSLLAQHPDEGFIIINNRHEITDINDKITELSDYTLEELNIKPFKFLFSSFNSKEISVLLDKKNNKSKTLELIRKDGTGFFVEAQVENLGRLKCFVFIKRISEEPGDLKKIVQKLQKELDKKNRMVAVQNLILAAKDELLFELKKRITAKELHHIPEIAGLIELIETDFNESKDWEIFKLQFEEIHPRFFRVLRQRSDSLTPADLKLCALLRINLSTKEISSILHINITSVNKKRNRLRKKLGITAKENINDFLAQL